ncbi:MAG: S9 family peptidase, partial [Rubrivivax sp.]|nr:S9 family peptidase [Rubrivivax sp.]
MHRPIDRRRFNLALLAGAFSGPSAMAQTHTEDPYLWLEAVHGEKAMAWVRERNAATEAVLHADPGFGALQTSLRAVLDSREQIPYVVRRGDALYNFWRDDRNPRGLWRRTSLAEYRKLQPAWDTVLDIDALGKAEGENWVWAGATAFGPDYQRCLLALSRGGADATVVREFDLVAKQFVGGGFSLPEAKTRVDWIDIDHLYVASDFGPGSLTDSGYPRIIKRWRRGTPLSAATTVFEGQVSDVSVSVSVDRTPGFERTVFGRATDFYNALEFLQAGEQQLALPKPSDASLSFWREHVLIELRSDWVQGGQTWPRGALLVGKAADFMAGKAVLQALFLPTAARSLAGFTATRSTLVL